ncbi:uncharacterized protein ColSpa_02893 [Colletotrichum spaethianum]|uniref:Uncharacterized protein n=1 Tax=Colletotrichum spaethianum TaxID=700344 RepID=A0AA37NV13_9PEZI|nr:uncharacterized protein ColSpa_02893 [Colletotrichum spaethianum]GKT42712.1 hypothetical protein ColSpa_02893 [Colletotrichum spaethianum]
MNFADHFGKRHESPFASTAAHARPDGCSFIYEDDRTTITNGHAVNMEGHPTPQPLRDHGVSSSDPHENIRAWLSGITVDEENKPLVTDVFYALGNLQNMDSSPQPAEIQPSRVQKQTRANVKVHTMGPGFIGRAPPFGSSEFFANLVVVAILLLFAPGFTILAAGVFVTSRVAERWAGQDQ